MSLRKAAAVFEGKRLGTGDSARSKEGKALTPCSSTPKCTSCEKGDISVKYCTNCEDYLCHNCVLIHRSQRIFKTHHLVETDESTGKVFKKVVCLNHSSEEVNGFCKSCKDSVCISCQKGDHKLHEIVEIEKSKELVDEACSDYAKKLEASIIKLQDRAGHLGDCRKLCIKAFDEKQTIIRARKAEIIELVDNTFEKNMQVLETQKEMVISLFDEIGVESKNTLKNSSSIKILKAIGVSERHQRLQDLQRKVNRASELSDKIESLKCCQDLVLDDFKDRCTAIETNTKKYLSIGVQQQSRRVPIDVLIKSLSSDKELHTPNELTLKEMEENNLKLVNKTRVNTRYIMSKRMGSNICCYSTFITGKTGLLQFQFDEKNEIVYEEIPDQLPRIDGAASKHSLTLSSSRFLIKSKREMYLCSKDQIILSTPINTDGFKIDALAFYNDDKFVALSTKTSEIRYYCTKTLSCLETYKLCDTKEKELNLSGSIVIYVTQNGELVTLEWSGKCTFYSAEGLRRDTRSIDLHECRPDSIIFGIKDQMFGVTREGDIYMFLINGEHAIVGSLGDDMNYLVSSSSYENHLYICFTDNDSNPWISRYRYR